MKADVRKIVVVMDEVHREMGRVIAPPTRRAAAAAVIANPFAGTYVEDLSELIEIGAEMGDLLGRKCVAALGIAPAQAESYGKAAMVGENGELEHAAALLHPKLGAPLRAAVEKGAALVPSSKKRGGPGQPLDIPLGHKDAAAQPFRRHGSAHQRCPQGQRDLDRRGRHRQRATAAPGRRPDGRRDQGRRRPALTAL